MVEQIIKTLPRKAAALASPVHPFPQSPDGLFVKLFQPVAVARHPIVVVITTELEVQRGKQFSQRYGSALFAPLREAGQRIPKLLAGGPPLHMRLTGAILLPRKLEPQKVELCCPRLTAPAEGNHPAFGGGQFQSILFQAKFQCPVEVPRFVLILECTQNRLRIESGTPRPYSETSPRRETTNPARSAGTRWLKSVKQFRPEESPWR